MGIYKEASVSSYVGRVPLQSPGHSPTIVTRSAPIICHRACSMLAHDPLSVCDVTPNTCMEIPKNHKYILRGDVSQNSLT